MTDLSPAAQAVFTAFGTHPLHADHIAQDLVPALAAALRAAADQVVPADPCGDDCCITQCEQIRAELLAIAAELEAKR